MTITAYYDPMLFFESRYLPLAIVTFILAITCVLVVALNALISILADSFARLQEKAVANRRRELASLCVEYFSLLPPVRSNADARCYHSCDHSLVNGWFPICVHISHFPRFIASCSGSDVRSNAEANGFTRSLKWILVSLSFVNRNR